MNDVLTSRRTLLCGFGAVGAAGLLGACGGGDGAGESTSPADAAAGTTLASTSDVRVGGGKVVRGVLIVQPSAGTFKAYSTICPHQGSQIGTPRDGVITCPSHFSTFKDSDGSRISGPAPTGLTEVPITVSGSTITKA